MLSRARRAARTHRRFGLPCRPRTGGAQSGRASRGALARLPPEGDRPPRAPTACAGPHGIVVLSEQALTVLAVANNPHPDQFKDVQVRVRDGLVVVSARISAGPFTPTGIAHISLALQPGAAGSVIAAQVPEIDIGMLGLPGFA